MPSTLENCLQTHITVLHDFLDLTEQEHEVLLQTFEPDTLAQLTQRKNQLLLEFLRLDHLRQQHLDALGVDHNIQGLSALAQAQPELAELVHQLIELSTAARQQNENNGVLIQTYLNSNQQALDTLSALAGKNNFYTAHGKPSPQASSSRSLKA